VLWTIPYDVIRPQENQIGQVPLKQQTLPWAPNPSIYQINTWVWLNTLSRQYGKPIDLHNIPPEVYDHLAAYQFDAIWLMGVWYRTPVTRKSALNYIHEYRGALHDVTEEDVIGSAYALGGYEVDERLGGREGLAQFRSQLRSRGIGLMLDFIPNHTAIDHRWIAEHPEYYLTATAEQLKHEPGMFFRAKDQNGKTIHVAHGRDPYFPSWIDTAQLNAFHPGLRQAALEQLLDIASQCDGVRCDMAMLMLNQVFQNTWGWVAGESPEQDYWELIVPQVKAQHPGFLFIAEVYWGLEHALHLQGFDYTYDKTLYDRLKESNVDGIYVHLRADRSYIKKNIRFIENHDEERAITAFGIDRSRPAAVVMSTLPGAKLYHDGQFSGRYFKLPVHIKRQPDERRHLPLERFYKRLLQEISHPIYQTGRWQLFNILPAFPDDHTIFHILAYGWQLEDEYRLIVVNLTANWSMGYVDMRDWNKIGRYQWQCEDALEKTVIYRSGDELIEHGFYVELEPFQSRIYRMTTYNTPVKNMLRRFIGTK